MNVECPRCGRLPVTRLHSSTQGVYCQCPGCGHMWEQVHEAPAPRPRPGTPQRRRSDFARIARQDEDCDLCRHLAGQLLEVIKRVGELEAENASLRQSSRAFGDLAERLNQVLRNRKPADEPQ